LLGNVNFVIFQNFSNLPYLQKNNVEVCFCKTKNAKIPYLAQNALIVWRYS